MFRLLLNVLNVALLIILSTSHVRAVPILIYDPSFELNWLAPNGYTNGIGPEWNGDGGDFSEEAYEEWIPGFAADGNDHLGIAGDGYSVSQDLSVLYQADTRYTLTVAIGNRRGYTRFGNRSTYFLSTYDQSAEQSRSADASIIAAAGTFADAPPLIIDTTAHPEFVGLPIRIRLVGGGNGRSHFDNIRLEATALGPPESVQNLAADQILAKSATLGAVVGGDGDSSAVVIHFGRTDGGTDPAQWENSVPAETDGNQVLARISGLVPGTTYHFRAFATNSAGSVWAPHSASFATLPASAAEMISLPATRPTGATATLRGEIISTGNDLPSVTIFYGSTDGGSNPTNWQKSVELGPQSGNFQALLTGLSPTSTYVFRFRAVNAGGTTWTNPLGQFTTTQLTVTMPVINEIHYHPDDVPGMESLSFEFLELHNPGETDIDISRWKIADAVSFTIPNGTVLAAGGHLVIAADPTAIQAHYQVSALGPWSGKLSNEGETIDLLNAAGALADRVSYKPGFPWPTAADGDGPSMELIHPSLDNDLAGSWRSSGTPGVAGAEIISASSGGWKFKRGAEEASSPIDAWRKLDFDDSEWDLGIAPFGYGNSYALNTDVNVDGAMRGVHRSIYYRKYFIVEELIPDQLALRINYDDGFIASINGTEIARANVGGGEVSHDGGDNMEDHPAGDFETFAVSTIVNGNHILKQGLNVLTVHSLNLTSSSGDYYFDAGLSLPGITATPSPSPGAANRAALPADHVPPLIRQVAHTPQQPRSGETCTITARVTDLDGVAEVKLEYQIVDPGGYIRVTDSAYENSWTETTMHDDGQNGDHSANDGNFSVVLPADMQVHRRLIRYRIACTDELGNRLKVPYSDDEQPNFAYFVFDGIPSWTGAFRPRSNGQNPATPEQTWSPETVASVQAYHLIASPSDIQMSQYDGNSNGRRFRGTFVSDGVVYDHIEFKNRGIGSTYVAGKNKWNIFFSRSRDFVPRDNWGKKYKETWNNLPLNANAAPWIPLNRGAGGIEEAVSTRIFELAGNLAFRTHYVQLRVIDGAQEASPSNQYDGDLWGLYLALEPTEGNLLDERNLPDGNIYAINGNSGDKKNQGDGQPIDHSDWNSFRSGLEAAGQSEQWYRDNIDLDSLYNFLALNRLIGNVDVRPGDNYRFYHRASDGKWVIIAYDMDMMFVPAHHWGGPMDGAVVAGQPNAIRAIMRHPELAREYRNRCREILDLLASDPAPAGGQIAQLFAEYASLIAPPGQVPSWVELDNALWNLNPLTSSSHRDKFGIARITDSRGGLNGTVATNAWLRTLPDPDRDGFSDFQSHVQWFVDFATPTYPSDAAPWMRKATLAAGGGTDLDPDRQKGYGYKYLEWESLYGGYADSRNEPLFPPHLDFPDTPILSMTESAEFVPSEFSDPQGPATYAGWQWRIAKISAPGIPGHISGTPLRYEIEPTFQSEVLTSQPQPFTIPIGITATGGLHRVRVRYLDTEGNWSHWSAPAALETVVPTSELIHYWNFNNSADLLTPTVTRGRAGLVAPAGNLSDDGKSFAGENARVGDPAGTHLRFNDPLGKTLNFQIPTTGYEGIIVRYESRRSDKGAGIQVVSYTTDGTTYTGFASFEIADNDPNLWNLDFRNVPEVANNPRFALRIAFELGAGGTGGNHRFDNFTVEGDRLAGGSFASWQDANFPGISDPKISGPSATPLDDGVENLIRYASGIGADEPVSWALPRVVSGPDGQRFHFRYDPMLIDLIWKVHTSDDLIDWNGLAFDSELDPVPSTNNGWASIPMSLGKTKSFVRLEVRLREP